MSAPKPRHSVTICVLLIVLTVVTFYPALNCAFVNLDDNFYVTQNPKVSSGLSFDNIFWVFKNTYYGNWHPLTLISHMLDVQLFGLNPAGHHATNLIFHVLNVLLLFVALQQMTGRVWPSAFVAALFAVHPSHVESVAWVSERKDVLSTFFGLLSLLAYLQYVGRARCPHRASPPLSEAGAVGTPRPTSEPQKSAFFYVLSLVFFALGLMSKGMLVTLPFVMLLLDYWPLKRLPVVKRRESGLKPINVQPTSAAFQNSISPIFRLILEKLPFFALTLVFSVISSHALVAANAIGGLKNLTTLDIASNAFISYLRYIGKLFWPVQLAAFYPRLSFPLWLGMASAAIILLLSVGAVGSSLRRPYITLGWFWFVGMLVPVTAVPLGDHSIADRYTYLSFIGLFIVVAWGAVDIAARWRVERSAALTLVGLAVIGALAGLSHHQLRYWRTSQALFERVLTVTGEGLMVHNDLGVTLQQEGDLAGAEEHFRAAVRLEPTNAIPRVNLIKALMGQKRTNEVLAQYHEWLELNPSDADARENFGLLLGQLGQHQEAAAQFETLVRLKPDAQSHYRLALALLLQGKAEGAVSHYQEAIRLKPDWQEPLNDLAWLLATHPRADLRNGVQAVELAERACKLTHFKEARFLGTLDAAYAEAGRFPEAITTAKQTKSLALAAGDKTIADLADERLKLYRSGVPFHQQQ
jgi:tetratricopeptide (TPR) repeat protein